MVAAIWGRERMLEVKVRCIKTGIVIGRVLRVVHFWNSFGSFTVRKYI
jgi:hypothetical protein